MDLQRVANVIRGLAADGVQKANSGHPGAPLGLADVGAVLYFDFLKHNPANSKWPNRDRFVLSGGHGSMLLYSLLHLSGYQVSLDDLKNFRQLGSNTPGHPEYGDTDGVETTTGPLGQGIANAVGMAIGERMAAARFNRPGMEVVDHYTYVLAGDGDLMEGVSSEASSLAGHLKLGKLIAIYDSNQITIEGSTELAFTESVKGRYLAYGWQVLEVDGHSIPELQKALAEAQANTEQPTLIIAHTQIAKGAPTKAGLAETHGAPLGAEEIAGLKKGLGLPEDEDFYVPDDLKNLPELMRQKGEQLESEWKQLFDRWSKENPQLAEEWNSWMSGVLPDLSEILTMFGPDAKMATRAASGQVLNAIARKVPNLVGGSADLAPSNNSFLHGEGSVQAGDFSGRNFNFGVREHGMAAILNGLALYGHFRVFGATFLVFSDYMRPSMRLAALMGLPVVYILTHDSVYVGEDGPTHQPIETTESLRLIPNLAVFRPADAEETAWSWVEAMKRKDGPSALILTRQNLPLLKKPQGWDFTKGGYVVRPEQEDLAIVLVAAGSEVSLAVQVAEQVEKPGLGVRVVSVPNRGLFLKQDQAYRSRVIPQDVPTLAIELGVATGWYAINPGGRVEVFGLERFGASGPGQKVVDYLGFTAEAIAERIMSIVK
ncbi:MAG TPA: transketolase [Firmicutes bacterium]|jgi:transketolase|nr:transketolase [Bacillota bacterium]HHT42677.1 transketolase [Bacillota bacterium]